MTPSTRRRLLATLAGAGAPLAGCTTVLDGGDGSDDTPPDGQRDVAALERLPEAVTLDAAVDGLEMPVAVTAPPAWDWRYVLEQAGRVRAFDDDGLRESPALDLTDAVVSGGETGLLGLAFHPEFPDERRAFVRYSAPPRPGTPDAYSHTFVLASFPVADDGTFVAERERTVLEIPQPQANHNAGDLAFGPDGLLYVPTGDGGGANDRGRGHPADWYDAVPGGNGQDVTEQLLGGVLRVDVDAEPTEHPRTDPDAPGAPTDNEGYAVPESNPLVGRAGRDEYYAWGLRNPWQLSFDVASGSDGGDADADGAADADADGGADADADEGDDADGSADADADLFVADVGQSGYEEVNLVERGGNYGWNVKEGAHCFDASSCPDETPADVRGGERLRDPIVEYPRSGAAVSGISVIGGHRYRGSDVPGLDGAYVFGDLQPENRLFAAVEPEDGGQWPTTTVDVAGANVEALFAFARRADDELYAVGTGDGGGTVWRIRPWE